MKLDADTIFMREALAQARLGWGMTNPNPMVGAVVVRDGEIIGRGYHHRAGMPHAEIEALNDLRSRGIEPAGAEMYVTLEPCSTCGRTGACTEAIKAAGISRVVIGCTDPNPAHAGRGIEILRSAGIEVESGILSGECSSLNYTFFKWITTRRPFVTLKLATTLDGRIATASGCSKWITGEVARSRVQELRRIADGIMVGGETLRLDHPQLTVREPEKWRRQPWRFIATSRAMSKDELLGFFPDGRVETVNLPDKAAWDKFLEDAGRREITNLLIEGGGEVAASALAAGAVDRLEFHIAPKVLGGRDSRPAVGGLSPLDLASAYQLKNVEVKTLGNDVMIAGEL